MIEPIEGLARAKLVEMCLDLSVQLERGTGTRPMLWILSQARARAADAIFALAKMDISADKIDEMRALQNEITLYGDMMESAKKMLIRGTEVDQEMTEEDRLAIAEFLTTDQAREIGVQTSED